MSIELKSLIGLRWLDAVDYGTVVQPKAYGKGEHYSANSIRFRLDGVVYVAIEDENDGYRSACADVFIGAGPMTNVFPKTQVLGTYIERADGRAEDVMQFTDVISGLVVLEVGTSRTDDYYPSFVSNFRPESIHYNAVALKLTGQKLSTP